MQFKDIIGQESIKKRLIDSVNKQRISHAQLFLGSEGNGKLGLAIAYAQYICCKNKQEGDSCGKCTSCIKYSKLVHPDLHFVFPVVKSPKIKKPVSDEYITQWRGFILDSPYHRYNDWLKIIASENQQGGIFTDESQSIIRKLNLKTFEAEYKIMIIWMPEKMNAFASNKLLKMIEEPPQKTLFILVAASSEEIIPTILSRTQLLKIPKIDNQNLSEAIKAKFDIGDEQAELITRIANGDYIKAMEAINENEDTQKNFDRFTSLMRLCYGYKVIDAMAWVDELAKEGRERQKNFLIYALRLLRENFVLNKFAENANQLTYLTQKEFEFSKKFATFINERNIFNLVDEFNKAHYHIGRNANGKIVLFDLSLQIMRLLRK